MSTPKTSLNSRYLKARLKPFTRPLFLGSLGMISFFAFCVWQYWHQNITSDHNNLQAQNPQGYPYNGTQPSTPGYTWGVAPRNYQTPQVVPANPYNNPNQTIPQIDNTTTNPSGNRYNQNPGYGYNPSFNGTSYPQQQVIPNNTYSAPSTGVR